MIITIITIIIIIIIIVIIVLLLEHHHCPIIPALLLCVMCFRPFHAVFLAA